MSFERLAESRVPPSQSLAAGGTRARGYALILLLLALISFGTGWALLYAAGIGPLTRHMGGHFLLMNLLTPLLALAAAIGFGARAKLTGLVLFAATTVQLALLWAWHFPDALAFAHAVPGMAVLMQASLAAAAFAFWLAVFSERGRNRWRAVLALAITGKLFCLLGVLIVFAPRPLYAALMAGHSPAAPDAMLADQHLAGLIMLAVCPLTYVAAGVAISARWLWELADDARAPAVIRPVNAPDR